MARYLTANEVLNRVAIEVSLSADSDPVGSSDGDFVQMRGLLAAAGQELLELWPWQQFRGTFDIATKEGDSGSYDLPDDYAYLRDRTGWDLTNSVPIGGPVSAQEWARLEGRNLVTSTIYATYRLAEGKMDIFPQPPPIGIDLRFEYVKRDWVQETGGGAYKDDPTVGTDVILYEPIMIIKFLKAKWLETKGFDASAARLEFENIFEARTGHDEGGATLNIGAGRRGIRYINGWGNLADSWPHLDPDGF